MKMKTTEAANVMAVARGFCHCDGLSAKLAAKKRSSSTDGKQLVEQGVIFCRLVNEIQSPLWAHLAYESETAP